VPQMIAETPPEPTGRHPLFDAARRSADMTVQELWISYLTLGGQLRVVDLEGYLSGAAPMPLGQQDVLACALNERLADLAEADRVPYLTVLPDRFDEALGVLEDTHPSLHRHRNQGLDAPPAAPQHQDAERTGPEDACRPRRELIFERF
jgi:hypothetical protein